MVATSIPVSKSQQKRQLKAKLNAQPSSSLTAFREVEKKYLARNPPPDYSDVLDFALEDLPCGVEVHTLERPLYELAGERALELIGTEKQSAQVKVYTFAKHPGIILIPGAIGPQAQRTLIRNCLRQTTRKPNLNNLDTHYKLPEEGLWYHYENHTRDPSAHPPIEVKTLVECGSVPGDFQQAQNSRRLITTAAITSDLPAEILTAPKGAAPPSASVTSEYAHNLMFKMRWTNLGLMYHWTTKSYHFEEVYAKGPDAMIPVPSDLATLSKVLLTAIPKSLVPPTQDWATFRPESGIVNFYQLRNTLMGHIDQSELVEDQPLVSFSFGHSAVFLVGGTTRDEKPTAIYLKSGDALIMSGPCRRVYHGVPRIVEGTLPPYLDRIDKWSHEDREAETQIDMDEWHVFADYLSTTRINVNIRQVFPENYFDTKNSA